jgi:hypothetical protein
MPPTFGGGERRGSSGSFVHQNLELPAHTSLEGKLEALA